MNKEYQMEEALKEVFENLDRAILGKDLYDYALNYKKRWEQGKLGQKAIDNLLSKFGYKKVQIVHYIKEKSNPTKDQ